MRLEIDDCDEVRGSDDGDDSLDVEVDDESGLPDADEPEEVRSWYGSKRMGGGEERGEVLDEFPGCGESVLGPGAHSKPGVMLVVDAPPFWACGVTGGGSGAASAGRPGE